MKKKTLLVVASLLLLTGCGKTTDGSTIEGLKPTTEVPAIEKHEEQGIKIEENTTEQNTTTSEEDNTPSQEITEAVTNVEDTANDIINSTLPKLYQIEYSKELPEEYIEALKTGVCTVNQNVNCNFDKLLYRLKGGEELKYSQAVTHDITEFSNVSQEDLLTTLICISTDYGDTSKDFVQQLTKEYMNKGISTETLQKGFTDQDRITTIIMKAVVGGDNDDFALAKENFQKLILDGKVEYKGLHLDFNQNKYGEYDFYAVRSDLKKLKEMTEEDRINFLTDIVMMITIAADNDETITSQVFYDFLSDLANNDILDSNSLVEMQSKITQEKITERMINATH